METVRIGQKITLKSNYNDSELHLMLCSVPSPDNQGGKVAVNFINIRNGNRWNDQLFYVDSIQAHTKGLPIKFIEDTIIDLSCVQIHKY